MDQSFDLQADETAVTILVVDDIAANRAVICRRLEMLSYAVVAVETGREALNLIAQSQPDIVLLDYMMPQMNGIDVLRELRSDPATSDLPVIMVTARAESHATVEALDAGADDYVTKPIDYDVLKARIDSHVNRKSDARGLKRANAAMGERMTMRSLVLADLEHDLGREIARRQELEAQLAACGCAEGGAGAGKSAACQAPSAGQAASGLGEGLCALRDEYESVFNAVMDGKLPNIAHMSHLRETIDRLIAGSGQPGRCEDRAGIDPARAPLPRHQRTNLALTAYGP